MGGNMNYTMSNSLKIDVFYCVAKCDNTLDLRSRCHAIDYKTHASILITHFVIYIYIYCRHVTSNCYMRILQSTFMLQKLPCTWCVTSRHYIFFSPCPSDSGFRPDWTISPSLLSYCVFSARVWFKALVLYEGSILHLYRSLWIWQSINIRGRLSNSRLSPYRVITTI